MADCQGDHVKIFDKGKIIQEEHIAGIFKEYTTSSRLLQSFANLSNTVIQTSLSGQSKYLFEILQNADDSFDDEGQTIEIEFKLTEGYLIIHHNGKSFDYNDVERICDYASQIEEVKETDLSKTGYKGLGFKSLFNISDCIYIYSNRYSFRFDKAYWPDPQNKPWQVIPIWSTRDSLPLSEKYAYDQPVNFIIKLNDINQIENQLKEIINMPEVLLYLHRINKLDMNMYGEVCNLERKVENMGSFKKMDFYNGQHVISTWIVITYNKDVSGDVRNFLRGGSKYIYPAKIKNAKSVPITIALQTDESVKEIKQIYGLCYSTLPTQLHITLPYHINSLFILNLDRTQLHENEWNVFLMKILGYLQLCLLRDLAKLPYIRNYVVEILNRRINHPFLAFETAFLDGVLKAKSEIAWLPAYNKQDLLKLGEAWIDETNFFRHNFVQDDRICPYLVDYEVKGQHKLTFHGVQHFTYLKLLKIFPDRYFPKFTCESYRKFISYLCEGLKGMPYESRITDSVKVTRFLVGKNKMLYCPKDVYLEETEYPVPDFLMLNCIDNNYLPLDGIKSVKEWLVTLGVTWLISPAKIIQETVLKWIASNILNTKINVSNHVEIIKYLAANIVQLAQREIGTLKEKFLVYTKSCKFMPVRKCYFSDAIPSGLLGTIVSDDEIISLSYNVDYLKDFFIRVGALSWLNPTDVLRKSILAWIDQGVIQRKITLKNYTPIIEYLAQHYSLVECDLKEHEKRKLKEMLVLTEANTFKAADVCYFDSAILRIKGLESIIPQDKLIPMRNTSNTVYKFLKKIGVSKEIEPLKVIRNIIQWIQQNEIWCRITVDNNIDILEYIAKNYFSIENLLTDDEKDRLKRIPVLTCDQTFQEARNCYFNDVVPNVRGLNCVIAKNCLLDIKTFSIDVKEFLKEIGVSALLEPVEVIRKSVLKWIKGNDAYDEITKTNYSDILGYISKYYSLIEDQLQEDEKIQLKRIPILTSAQTFQEAQKCYFDSAIPSVNGLKYIIPKNCIVRTKNFSKNILELFKNIGVSDKLEPLEVIRKSILNWIKLNTIKGKITKDNYADILEYTAKYYSSVEDKFLESERREIKKMLVFTVAQTFQEAEKCYFQSAVPQVKGLESVIPKNYRVYEKILPKHGRKFLLEIGVSTTLSAEEIVRRSILKWIEENEIRNEMTEANHKDILKYLAKEWIILRKGLEIKEKESLKNIIVLTENKSFRPALECYLSTNENGKEILGLSSIICPNAIISSDYDHKIESFLQELGIRELKFPNIYEEYSSLLTESKNVKWFFSKLTKYWKKHKSSTYDNKLLQFLQKRFQSSPCLLSGNSGKIYSSPELYSSQFCRINFINMDALPLLGYGNLPEDLEKWLGFKQELDLPCIIQLLEAIHKNPKLLEKGKRIFFTTLLEQLKLKHETEIKNYQLSLFSQENKLEPAEKLYYFTEENSKCELHSIYLQRIHGMSHADTLELAKLCGVNTLAFDEQITFGKEEKCDVSLNEFYLERLPFITIQESRELDVPSAIILKYLYNKICSMELHECSTICVKYPFGNCEIDSHFESLKFYVTGKWNGFPFKSDIHTHIRKQLNCKSNIDKIIDMESLNQRNKERWCRSIHEDFETLFSIEKMLQGFIEGSIDSTLNSQEIVELKDLIADENKLTTVESCSGESESEDSDNECSEFERLQECSVESSFMQYKKKSHNSFASNITNRGNRNSSHRLKHGGNYSSVKNFNESCGSDQGMNTESSHAKRLGEEYVFNCLQDFYKSEYPNSQCELSGNVFTLQWEPSHEIKITWVNKTQETEQPYDLMLEKDGEIKQIIEVKSTDVDWFNIGCSKIVDAVNNFFPKHKDKFCIYRVFNIPDSRDCDVESLKDRCPLYLVSPLGNSFI